MVEEIAEYFGTDPLYLEPPLFEAIDPDALDVLIAHAITSDGEDDISVEFTYEGCLIRVTGEGSVELSPQLEE